MTELIRYDAMCSAIAECHRIDEVKDLRDKAMALELYARQARNTDAERKASEVRLRAERRVGELLRELQRADSPNPAGRNQHAVVSQAETQPKRASPYAQALTDHGISRQTAHRYQALANVPAETFEAALREPDKPTTSGVIAKAAAVKVVQAARDPQPCIPDDVLWLWGRLRDFEREGFSRKSPAELLAAMTDTMRADVERIAPHVAEFFAALLESIHEHA